MTQIVKICQFENGLIKVKLPDEGKKSTSRTFWKIEEQEFQVLNPQNIELKAGDWAEIELDTRSSLLTSFYIFIFPLLIFMAFYILSGLAFSSDYIRIAFGAAGFAAGLFWAFRRGKKRASKETPVLTKKILNNEGLLVCSACSSCKGCG